MNNDQLIGQTAYQDIYVVTDSFDDGVGYMVRLDSKQRARSVYLMQNTNMIKVWKKKDTAIKNAQKFIADLPKK